MKQSEKIDIIYEKTKEMHQRQEELVLPAITDLKADDKKQWTEINKLKAWRTFLSGIWAALAGIISYFKWWN